MVRRTPEEREEDEGDHLTPSWLANRVLDTPEQVTSGQDDALHQQEGRCAYQNFADDNGAGGFGALLLPNDVHPVRQQEGGRASTG